MTGRYVVCLKSMNRLFLGYVYCISPDFSDLPDMTDEYNICL